MPTRPLISLVISIYNQAACARQVLRSAVRQTIGAPFEIVVCDDGSSDGYLEHLRSIAISDRIDIRYVWQPDRGFRLARSRNNAIRCSQADILAFVDGDTVLLPTFLEDHIAAHQTARSLVCGARYSSIKSGLKLDDLLMSDWASLPSPEHLRQRQWLHSSRPWMACLGGNFSVPNIPDVQFDEQFEGWGSEDRDLACRLFRSGLTPRLLQRPNAVHMKDAEECWTRMGCDGVVAFLLNKLKLRSKYPGGEMEPSLSLVRRCHLDAESKRWSIGDMRCASADEVLDQFERWYMLGRHLERPEDQPWSRVARTTWSVS
jgi:glycosyltransferase involved in cell wall biosynthesis